MRRIADLHPGEAKTDARDAFIIADAARTMPHTLRSVQLADEQIAELTMLCGFDDDLAKQATATSNRIRGLLTQIHPALERVLDPGWTTPRSWICCGPGRHPKRFATQDGAGSRAGWPSARPGWANASPMTSSRPWANRA